MSCSFLFLEDRGSHSCSKNSPTETGSRPGSWDSPYRVTLCWWTWLGIHRNCPRSQQEQICLQPRKVTSAQHRLTQCVYSKGTKFSGKGFRQLGARGYGDASPTYEDLLACCHMLASGLANIFMLHLPRLTADSGSAQWNSRWIFVRGFRLPNLNRLWVQLCGTITSNHMQPIFLSPTSEQTWLARHRAQATSVLGADSFWAACLHPSIGRGSPTVSLWCYETTILSFGMHSLGIQWEAAACFSDGWC